MYEELDKFLMLYDSYETRKSYRSRILNFIRYLEEKNISFPDITSSLVLEYVKNQKNITANASISAIKMFYHYLTKKPLNIETFQANTYRPDRNLSITDAQKMIYKAIKLRDKYIIKILVELGIRVNELATLTKKNVHKRGQDYYIEFIAKGAKARHITLDKEQYSILKQYVSGKATIFGVSKRQIERIVKDLGEKALNRLITPHCLRHCFATELMRQGVSFQNIQEALGHDNLMTTLKYLHNERSSEKWKIKLKLAMPKGTY